MYQTNFRRMHRKLVTWSLQERELSGGWRVRWKRLTFLFEFTFSFGFYFDIMSKLQKSCKNKIELPIPFS